MKKTVACALVLFFALALSALAQQLYHINFDNLPTDAAFRAQVTEFAKVYPYVSSWHAEWKFELAKDKAIDVVTKTLAAADKAIAGASAENIDLLLFRALLKKCLYNADVTKYKNDIITELKALEKKYPADYRAAWLLGVYFADAADPFDAVREFERLMNETLQGNVPTDVLADFCSISYMALMFSTTRLYLDAVVRADNIKDPRQAFGFYDALQAHFLAPAPGTVVAKDKLFSYLKREHGTGFLCRLFGAWLPVKDDWKVTLFDTTKENMGGVMVEVPFQATPGKRIGAGMSVVFQALSRQDFTYFVQRTLGSMKNAVPLTEWKGNWPGAAAYEFSDPDMYKENGGGHGLVVFIKRGQPNVKGIGIEAPSTAVPPKAGAGVRYVSLPAEYTRFDGDVYYAFVLDSCAAIYEPSKAAFLDWLNNVQLD